MYGGERQTQGSPCNSLSGGPRGAKGFSSRTVQALGAGPMSWSPEMHAYRVAARVGNDKELGGHWNALKMALGQI